MNGPSPNHSRLSPARGGPPALLRGAATAARLLAFGLAALAGCFNAPADTAAPPTTQSAASNGLCSLPALLCSGTCRDATSDRANCGACGAACTGAAVCSHGTCRAACDNGLTNCAADRTCHDLASDPRNCGACGRVCPGTNSVCSRGVCTTASIVCGTGLTACGAGACLDLTTDPYNCGACGRACSAGQACVYGACALPTVCAANGTTIRDQAQTAGTAAQRLGATTANATSVAQYFAVASSGFLSTVELTAINCGAITLTSATSLKVTVRDDLGQTLGAATLAGNLIPVGLCNASNLTLGSAATVTLSVASACIPVTRGQRLSLFATLSTTVVPTCSGGRCSNQSAVTCSGTNAAPCQPTVSLGYVTTNPYPAYGMSVNNAAQSATADLAFRASITPFAVSCAGQTNCNGVCRDLLADRNNCGVCGAVCAAGQLCSGGTCTTTCLAGLTTCGTGATATCANIATDNANCGACGTVCPAGRVCSAGTCVTTCGAGIATCGTGATAYCANTATDRSNCGTCGTVCAAGQVCSAGACATSCLAGTTTCGAGATAYCANTATDNANCGACGNACPSGRACSGGVCALTCGGLAACGSGGTAYCASTATDRANCGACGTACAAGQVCSGGVCATSCLAGTTTCGTGASAYCANTQSDNANCGACGTTCAAGRACSAGACVATCGAANILCGTGGLAYCAVSATDGANCGACGTTCAAGSRCVAGACTITCGAGMTVCGAGMAARCTNLQSEDNNCGACGVACAAGNSCQAGVCVPTCGTGQTFCAGACRAFATDRAHCGACGTECAAGQVCSAGACATSCSAGLTTCGTGGSATCANLATDNAHCGACGVVCAAGRACSAGACAVTCAAGQTQCSGTCRDLAHDNAHCGACGATCAAGQVCSGGACVATCGGADTLCGTACAALASDPTHCGACATSCPAGGAHTAPVCLGGGCATVCGVGYGNCDGLDSDGCESNLTNDANHCGACGSACGFGQVCLASACTSLPAPRQMAPLSTATVTSQRPTLRWTAASAPSTGAHVQLCSDNLCNVIVDQADVTGTSWAPATPLTAGVYFWRVLGTDGATTSADSSPVWEFIVGARSVRDSSSGTTLDVNGDGYADVVVTAFRSNTAYLYLGGPSGLDTTPTTTLAGPAGFGVRTASAGDVDGDGYSDLLVGAHTSNSAFLYRGGAAGISPTPTATLTGPSGSGFGFSVSSAGDVNGDGYADVVVGTTDSSTVYFYFGSATGLGATPTTLVSPIGGNFGLALAGAGDVNGDGFGDVLVCVQQSNAYLYYGSATGLNPTPTTLPAPGDSSYFGRYAIGAGDLNGDGYSDVAVGASVSSTAYVYYGSATGLNPTETTLSGTSGSYFSEPMGAGDVDADGFSDLIVGENGGLGNPGLVYVYPGSATGLSSTRVTLATPAGTYNFGSGVAGTGDVNGDGYGDVMVGSTGDNSAYLYLGSATGVSSPPTTTFPNPSGADGFGLSIASADPVRRLGGAVTGATTPRAANACYASATRAVTPASRRTLAA